MCSAVEPGGALSDKIRRGNRTEGESMGRRRRGLDEFDDETRESGGGWIVAATFIKYAALVIIVLVVAYVVLRIVGVLQGALF